MKNIYIEEVIKEKCPEIILGYIECDIKIESSNNRLLEKINQYVSQIRENLKTEDISKITNIKSSRDAYKKMGKDPTRYRVSAEALLRRAVF